MITFTRHVAPDGTISHSVDSFEKDTSFHLASLDGRIPGVKIEGDITIEAANGKAHYRITGVDPQYFTILGRLEEHTLENGEFASEDVAPDAQLNPHLEHVYNPLSDTPSQSTTELARLSEEQRATDETRRIAAGKRADQVLQTNAGTANPGYVPANVAHNPDGSPVVDSLGRPLDAAGNVIDPPAVIEPTV